MTNITVHDDILTDIEPDIKTDEINKPRDGKDGEKGKDGVTIKGDAGKDGERGQDGHGFVWAEHAEKIRQFCIDAALKWENLTDEQRESLRGLPGKNGTNGTDGKDGVSIKGDAGANGRDGTQWHIFKNMVNDKVGSEGDIALVLATMNIYQRIKTNDVLVWKWLGCLKGRDGVDGRNGHDGSGGGGGVFINHIYKKGTVLHMFNSEMIQAKSNGTVLVFEVPQHKSIDLIKVDLSGENIGQFAYGIQSDLGDDDTFNQIGLKRTNYTKYDEQVDLCRRTIVGPSHFVVKALNPRPTNANYEATLFYDIYNSQGNP